MRSLRLRGFLWLLLPTALCSHRAITKNDENPKSKKVPRHSKLKKHQDLKQSWSK